MRHFTSPLSVPYDAKRACACAFREERRLVDFAGMIHFLAGAESMMTSWGGRSQWVQSNLR